ncbi:MAG: hypothetical protein EO766_13305 [Hydrotalea sp. AMD]|uniref:RyR domain-containing protein n=1 Tax=Hydrotalea sp. AMD TaxID=2501297 RepID=UPI00102859B6|nr:RyR domain-containing protein [Hydrotalea sp. AMD]RWZ86778.1 MAG: hypothetical protein EO766_13305 [Hydrotalea sp. AMD]
MSYRTDNRNPVEQIAVICHQTNKAWCEMNGDFSQKDWHDAPDWQRESAVKGVEFRLANPDATPEAQHESWYKAKEADGWVYGEVKDAEAKTHPCMVEYDQLPLFQRKKDELFGAIVEVLRDTVPPEEETQQEQQGQELKPKQEAGDGEN